MNIHSIMLDFGVFKKKRNDLSQEVSFVTGKDRKGLLLFLLKSLYVDPKWVTHMDFQVGKLS